MSEFTTYYEFMDKYEEFYKTVKQAEEEKLEAILSNDLSKMESSLSAYESIIKQAKQYEEKRMKLCASMGVDGTSFEAVSAHFEGEEKQRNGCAFTVHIAKKGETLWSVSKILGCTTDEIIKQNPTLDSELTGGERIIIYRCNC